MIVIAIIITATSTTSAVIILIVIIDIIATRLSLSPLDIARLARYCLATGSNWQQQQQQHLLTSEQPAE